MIRFSGVYLFIGCLTLTTLPVFTAKSYLTEQPSFFRPCASKAPELTKCVTESIRNIMKEITDRQGLPGLPALPPLDPFHLKKVRVDQGGNGAVNLNVDLTNIEVIGFRNLNILEAAVNPKDFSFNVKMFLPQIDLKADYSLMGKMLLINLNGRGNLTFNIYNFKSNLYTICRLFEKDGLTFCNTTDAKLKYQLEGLKIRFDNLFNGNKELEDSTNALFNENWKILNESLQPVIEATIDRVLLRYFKAIFGSIPAKFIISDVPTSKELYGR